MGQAQIVIKCSQRLVLYTKTEGTPIPRADFDFSRGSSATRVNSQGLIEDVQIIGGELITNGGFDTDSNWTKGSNTTIANGKATTTGTGAFGSVIYQSISLVSGNLYKISIDIEKVSGSQLIARWGSQNAIASLNSTGTFTNYFQANSTGSQLLNIFEQTGGNFVGSIDNVSIKEITDDTDLPRIDYTGGVGSILLEPQSTNLVSYSEDFTQWTLGSNSTLALDNSVTAPDGSTGVYRLTLPATSGTFIQANIFSAITGTLSIYVKSAGTVNNDFNLYSGSVASPLKTATSEWQRFTLENVISNSFYIINSGDTFISDIYIWGAQAEDNPFTTSYIPTVGSSVTRLGETLNNSGNADLFNNSEGVLYFEAAALTDEGTTTRKISINDGTDDNHITVYYHPSNDNTVVPRIFAGGVSVKGFTTDIYAVYGRTNSQFNKFAIRYSSNGIQWFLMEFWEVQVH